MTSESTADGGPAGVDDAATAAAAAVAEAKRLPRIPPPVPDKNQGSQSNRQRNNSNNNNNNNGANAASGRNKGNKNKGSLPPRAASAGGSSGPPRALSASGSTGSHRAATNANGSSGPSRAATNASGSNGSHRAAGSSSKQKGSSSSNSRAAGKPGRMARIDDADNDSDSNIGRVQYSRQRSRKSGKAGGVGGGRMFSGRLTMDDGSGGAAGDSDAMEGDLGAASNLSSVLARRLTCGDYECMICCDKVRARNAVWQCDRCWAIFHLGCVRRWAQACAADGPAAQWRCPGCQHARAAEPAHYVCFCGAQANPEPARRGAVPHACTRICGRRRGAHCPHPCAQPCHPGPCAPCTALAPEQWCFCGRVAHQPRCGAAFDPARAARSCGAPCGETLGCGRHACAQPCHAGLCAPCERTEQQPCRCGRNSRAVRCGSVPVEFDCGERCGALLDCGLHHCERTCHAPDADAHACPLDPARATTCHCGARPAASLLGAPRASCADAVPSCGAPCGRALPGCAHACAAPCHAGSCPPCAAPVDAPCACGATVVAAAECHAARADPPRCARVCGRKRACGRHKCGERCCAGGSSHAHACARVCGRSLRCGRHTCEAPCHRGECAPCPHVGLEALACACGLTRLEPPVACGAAPPPCAHACRRPRACGHASATAHECHAGPCPPCAVLVAARCMCGARELRAVACHRSHAASCGTPCGRRLACGGHVCQRSCHAGECAIGGQPCRQPCGKPRRACGHACPAPCHWPAACDEAPACMARVRAACACGRLTAERACGGTHAVAPLACDDVCRIAERNRRLALALNLPDRADAPLAGLVRATYADELLDFTRTNTSWVRGIENLVAAFMADARRPTLRFVSMKRPLREFLHALAPFYGCASRSVDFEPNRSVCWDRCAASTIPSIILSSAIRYAHAPQIVCSLRPSSSNDNEVSYANATTAADHRPPPPPPPPPIDYIAISDLRHGLTADELAAEIRKLFPNAPFAARWAGEDLFEVYCTDPAAASKHEHLAKWLAVLKKRLPHLGVAGLVTAQTASVSTARRDRSSSSSSSSQQQQQQPQAAQQPLVREPRTPEAWDDEEEEEEDNECVPDNWESLNINDDN